MKNTLVAIFCTAVLFSGFGADSDEQFSLTTSAVVQADAHGLYFGPAAQFSIESPVFGLFGAARFVNDGKWLPTETWMPEGFYFDLIEGSVSLNLLPFRFEGGFIPVAHWYAENPYLTILDSAGKSSVGMVFSYEGSMISYQTRWIGLNINSPFTYGYGENTQVDTKWRDRGMNYKLYMLKFDKLRLAYQESSMIMDRYFDVNYLLNPAPSIFINTIWSQGGNPWVHDSNDASLMGFYGDYNDGAYRIEAEISIKDINAAAIYPTNLNKFAWSLGGTLYTSLGDFSFWHGGATKHMYAASYQIPGNPNVYPYEYTYYPLDVVNGQVISLEDNYIGFPYGENALAFRLSWADSRIIGQFPVKFDALFEWVVSGSKSPHNPWHEYESCDEISNKTELFHGDPVLEHKLALAISASSRWRNIELAIAADLSVLINQLQLTHTPETLSRVEPPIWKPQEGLIANTSNIQLVVSYVLEL